MTNEEAIEILYNIRGYYASLTVGYPPHDCYGLGDMKCSDICNALLKGIKLLEQETILDKIRDEIEQVSYTRYFEYGEYIGEDIRQEHIVNFDAVMQIIDKYKVKSEKRE